MTDGKCDLCGEENTRFRGCTLSVILDIIAVIAVIGMIAYVGYIQIQLYKQTEDYCNNQYGVNGWELNETTGTGVNKYYIGQVWECVPLSNSSSDKSESFNKDLTENQK